MKLLFGFATFLSAFLLFLVQPLLGKYVLPWFGGGAGVWATVLAFFQLALLAGYAYAHALRSLLPHSYRLVHGGVLLVSLAALPLAPSAPVAMGQNPSLGILALLAATVGVPYVALASTGPMLQSWFAEAFAGRSPYRLYAVSNTGSLLALLAYPTVVEPLTSRSLQATLWSVGYVVLAGATLAILYRVRGSQPQTSAPEFEPAAEPGGTPPESVAAPSGPSRFVAWIGLAAVPSALLLATTNHVTQEVAAVPFLWVVPLAIYLVTFILCFDSDGWYRRRRVLVLLAGVTPAALWALRGGFDVGFALQLAIFMTLLFAVGMFCHGELVRMRPAPSGLTAFYLAIATGGALGGTAVALTAPFLFSGYWEIWLALAACWLAAWLVWRRRRDLSWVMGAALPLTMLAATLLFFGDHASAYRRDALLVTRNFYGTARVLQDTNDGAPIFKLYHGQTKHGVQFAVGERRRQPTTYYGERSGVGLLLRHHPARPQGPMSIGTVGLGVGTLATYGQRGDEMVFWELNPDIEVLARTAFSYLGDSDASVEIRLGDARLRMEQDGPTPFDVLVIDAFNSDSIPVHLLTAEAGDLYARHLGPGGVLAVHISNRFVELEGVVRGLAGYLNMAALRVRSESDDETELSTATWMLLTHDPEWLLEHPVVAGELEAMEADVVPILWTDEYASLWPVVDLR